MACPYCFKEGHEKERYWFFRANIKQTDIGRTKLCSTCGSTRHIKPYCPQNKPNTSLQNAFKTRQKTVETADCGSNIDNIEHDIDESDKYNDDMTIIQTAKKVEIIQMQRMELKKRR